MHSILYHTGVHEQPSAKVQKWTLDNGTTVRWRQIQVLSGPQQSGPKLQITSQVLL